MYPPLPDEMETERACDSRKPMGGVAKDMHNNCMSVVDVSTDGSGFSCLPSSLLFSFIDESFSLFLSHMSVGKNALLASVPPPLV